VSISGEATRNILLASVAPATQQMQQSPSGKSAHK
jgi:hypothetical protein